MSLATLLLVQAVSFTPTLENTRTFSPVEMAYEVQLVESPDPLAALAAGNRAAEPPSHVAAQSISLSDGYYTRLDIHRYASYGTLPLFAIEAIAGQKLLEEGSGAPLWAERVHKPAAYLVAGIFAVNTITGLLNYGEARKITQGRTRRKVHTILMLASTAGFIYSGTQAPSTSDVDERIANGTRGGWTRHKASAWASMTVATVGYLMMYVWKDE